MSESLPKPLSSIAALRAHLKLLERGVNDARTARTGPVPAPVQVPVPQARTTAAAARPAPASFRLPSAPRASDGKPKAKAKSGVDFGAFFGNTDKRAAS